MTMSIILTSKLKVKIYLSDNDINIEIIKIILDDIIVTCYISVEITTKYGEIIMMNDLGSTGRRLDVLMNIKGVNQKEVAKKIKSSQPQVSDWLKDKREISKANLEKIADYFGVTKEWLATGEGDNPEIIQKKLRDDYSKNTTWNFRPIPLDGGYSGGSLLTHALTNKNETLAKEDGQNTIDAGESIPDVTEQIISVIRLKGKPLERFKKALKWNKLSKHLKSVGKQHSKFGKKIKTGLQKCNNEIILLRLEDYNAIGLTGGEIEEGNFSNLTRRTLFSKKESTSSGGSYGLGKGVYWASSWINTVLFNSELSRPEEGGLDQNRIIGRTELCYHEVGKDKYEGPGWFGTTKKEQGNGFEQNISVSVWNQETLAKDLCMNRDKNKGPGTTKLITGYFTPEESDSTEKLINIAESMEENFAKWFTPALAEADLRASVRIYDTRKDELDMIHEKTVEIEEHMYPFFEMMLADRAEEISSSLSEPGDVVRVKVPLIIPEKTLHGETHNEFTHETKLLIRYAEPDESDTYLNTMSYGRGIGMTVNFKKYPNVCVGAIPFHAILQCGKSAENDSKTDIWGEEFLRAAEPPSHDRWESTEELKTDYKLGGKKKIDDFFEKVRKEIRTKVQPDTSGGMDGPDYLKQLFKFNIDNPVTSIFVVKKVTREMVDDSLELEIQVRKTGPADENKFEMKPVVNLEGEDGKADNDIAVKKLIPLDNCNAEDDLIVVNPRRRFAKFKIVMDKKKFLVPSEYAVLSVELKQIRRRVSQ